MGLSLMTCLPGLSMPVRVTLAGRPGDDAKRYQAQEVAQRIAAARAAKGDQR